MNLGRNLQCHRRSFILAVASIVGAAKANLLAGEPSTDGKETVEASPQIQVKRIPVYLTQKTVSGRTKSVSELVETIKFCRDNLQLSGFELSLSQLRLNAGQSFQPYLAELGSALLKIGHAENCGDFRLVLSVDCDAIPDALDLARQVSQAIKLSRCTVALPQDIGPDQISSSIERWHAEICIPQCTDAPRIMVETPKIFGGMELIKFSRAIKDIKPEMGILLRSDNSKYRFDLAVHDLQFALGRDANSNNAQREIASRFCIDVSVGRRFEERAFEREMYHRALRELFALGTTNKSNASFVCLESSQPLTWDIRTQSAALDDASRIFKEVMEQIKSDLVNFPA